METDLCSWDYHQPQTPDIDGMAYTPRPDLEQVWFSAAGSLSALSPHKYGTPVQLTTPPRESSWSEKTPEQPFDDAGAGYENPTISIATSFGPGAGLLPIPPDLIFLSSDAVYFYVHATQLLSLSNNNFNARIPLQPLSPLGGIEDPQTNIVLLPEDACTLNILFLAVYSLPCAQYYPTLDTLVDAVDAMPIYGLAPKTLVAPPTPLFALLLADAPLAPIVVYALAGAHDLRPLATPVSAHLLAFPLDTLGDALARRIGAPYLRRLFFLHLGRTNALKSMLYALPHPHAPTEECGFEAQKDVGRAWTLAAAYLTWEARPDHALSEIEGALCPLADDVPCEDCKKALANRIKQVVVQWSMVNRTIL